MRTFRPLTSSIVTDATAATPAFIDSFRRKQVRNSSQCEPLSWNENQAQLLRLPTNRRSSRQSLCWLQALLPLVAHLVHVAVYGRGGKLLFARHQ